MTSTINARVAYGFGYSSAESALYQKDDVPGTGDALAETAILLAQTSLDDRKRARAASDQEESARLREGEAHVRELHEKADAVVAEGWSRGICGIVGGATAIGGAAFALGDGKKGEEAMALGSGVSKALDGSGTLIGSGYQASEIDHQAESDRHEAASDAHKVARDKNNQEADDARQSALKMDDFLKDLNSTRNATLQAAVYLRG